MARLLSVLSLAAMLFMATGLSDSVTPSPALATDTNSMVASTPTVVTTSKTSTTSMVPSPTPVPPTPKPTPEPTDNDYLIMNPDNKTVCLHMMAGLTLKFMYKVGDKNMIVDVDLLDQTIHNDSACDSTMLKAVLKLQYTPKEEKAPYFLSFIFDGDKAAKTWNVSSIIVEFTFNKTDFPNYSGKEPSHNNVSIASLDRLFDAGNVSLNQSFGCEVNRSLPNFENITADLHLSLFMMNLTVQAFEFSNTTTGEFDTGVVCPESLPTDTGNKIVPIAVGAALAGLVIVVLVAYLIGRLRNRKKSSYEALS